MSDGYPESWYHGHKHVLDTLRYAKETHVPVGIRTVREALFEIEIDVTISPGASLTKVSTLHDKLTAVGFEEKPEVHDDDPLTFRYEWTFDGY